MFVVDSDVSLPRFQQNPYLNGGKIRKTDKMTAKNRQNGAE